MYRNWIFSAVIVGLAGCSTADIFVAGRGEVRWPRRAPAPAPQPVPEARIPQKSKHVSMSKGKGVIPPGHLPPPGACKIWKPGVPPGHQGQNQSCDDAFYYVRPGEMVILRDPYDRSLIEVHKAYAYGRDLYFEVEYYRAK